MSDKNRSKAKNNNQRMQEWRNRIKQRSVDAMGGCCSICGYDKYNGALEFHHLNPNDKEFTIGSIRANPKNWNDIILELKKCILLCSNCHKEIHGNVISVPIDVKVFDDLYAPIPKDWTPPKCLDCNKSIKRGSIRCNPCSAKHTSFSRRKVVERPSKEDLALMLESSSYVALGKLYGVSDTTIRKWLK